MNSLAKRAFGTAAALLLAHGASLFAQEMNDPAAELASFQLPAGFEANLFASEAEGVVKPIQMRWDARGRLWVICSTTYPLVKPGDKPDDKVLIIEDNDRDGRADTVKVFADGLMIPTGLELDPDGHGAWVGEGTKLWHLRDEDGDDHCEAREVVLRGFGTGDNHQNLNSFRWSPGGELFFCQGLHAFSRVETPWGVVGLDEAGFWRLRPKTLELESFYGGKPDPQNPWGWVWTDWGQPLLVAGNNGGIFYPLPEMVHGHDEMRVGNIWVDARSRKSSGPDIVGTAHLPPEWQGIFLTGGYMNNAVWALKIDEDGAGYRLTDLPPLVKSSHPSFRPIDVKIGPDGAIYLCDWYNPIIGHYQASFRHPDRDKTHGRIWRITVKDRPLIQQPKIADAEVGSLLENLKSSERWTRYESKRTLLARPPEAVQGALEAWAAGLKSEGAETERALYEAIGVYEALEAPAPALLDRLLKAKTADARAYACGVVARWQARLEDPVALLKPLVTDEHPRVRLAAVVALANMNRPDSLELVLAAAGKPVDRFLESALHQAVKSLKPRWLSALQAGQLRLNDAAWISLVMADGTHEVVAALRQQLGGRKGDLSAASRQALLLVLARVCGPDDLALLLNPETFENHGPAGAHDRAEVLGVLARSADERRLLAAPELASLLPVGSEKSGVEGGAELRAAALRLAGVWKYSALLPQILDATDDREQPRVRQAAIDALANLGGKAAQDRLLELAGEGDRSLRAAAVAGLTKVDVVAAAKEAAGGLLASDGDAAVVATLLPAFLARENGATALAEALRGQNPPPLPELSRTMLAQMQALGRQDPELLAILTRFSGPAAEGMKATPEFVAALVEEVRAKGNASHGAEIFQRADLSCTACHSVGGKGGTIGPSLDAIGSGQPLDFIIGAVIEPQREVKESFEAVEITTQDGQVRQGYRVREGKGELILRDVVQGRETTILKTEIAKQREIGSLMPTGLLDRLSREELRDLFRYLSGLGKPQ